MDAAWLKALKLFHSACFTSETTRLRTSELFFFVIPDGGVAVAPLLQIEALKI